MNNMYKPNLIPVLFLILLTSMTVACEENNNGYNDRDNYKDNSVDFPHTPDPVVNDHTDTATVRGDGTASDTAVRR